MGNDVESGILYGGDRCVGDEDRREQVKHTLIDNLMQHLSNTF